MYSVDDIIEQIDQDSDIDENLEATTEERQGEEENAKDENSENTGATKVEPKVKRKLAPRPKLDAERLKGPRGLICMEKMFSDLKFKGRGHEKHDLNLTMNMMQYWCHRLFPKFTFDDCLAQLEKLGTKKPVITLKKKILFDLIDEDTVQQDPDNLPVEEVTDSQQDTIDEFDRLFNQDQIPTSLPTTQPAVTAEVELTEEQREMIERNRQLAAERRRDRLEALKRKEEESKKQEILDSPIQHLTEEQKITIEKNRLLAIERRKQLQNKSIMSSQSENIEMEIETINETETQDSLTNESEINRNLVVTIAQIETQESETNESQTNRNLVETIAETETQDSITNESEQNRNLVTTIAQIETQESETNESLTNRNLVEIIAETETQDGLTNESQQNRTLVETIAQIETQESETNESQINSNLVETVAETKTQDILMNGSEINRNLGEKIAERESQKDALSIDINLNETMKEQVAETKESVTAKTRRKCNFESYMDLDMPSSSQEPNRTEINSTILQNSNKGQIEQTKIKGKTNELGTNKKLDQTIEGEAGTNESTQDSVTMETDTTKAETVDSVPMETDKTKRGNIRENETHSHIFNLSPEAKDEQENLEVNGTEMEVRIVDGTKRQETKITDNSINEDEIQTD